MKRMSWSPRGPMLLAIPVAVLLSGCAAMRAPEPHSGYGSIKDDPPPKTDPTRRSAAKPAANADPHHGSDVAKRVHRVTAQPILAGSSDIDAQRDVAVKSQAANITANVDAGAAPAITSRTAAIDRLGPAEREDLKPETAERATMAARRGEIGLGVVASVHNTTAKFDGASAPAKAQTGSDQQPARQVALIPKGQQVSLSALIERSWLLLKVGNVKDARETLSPVVSAGLPSAVLALAKTYDPSELKNTLAPAGAADLAKATELYAQAAKLGSLDARLRLDRIKGISPPGSEPQATPASEPKK